MARTLTDLIAALEPLDIPMTQVDWMNGTEPELPYIVLVPSETSNFFADGVVNETPVLYLVDMYARERDMATEAAVQTAMNGAGIGWERAVIPLNDGRAVLTRWYAHVFER